MKPVVCILRTDGTNCDRETAAAFAKAGARTEFAHVNHLRSGEKKLSEFDILAIPGGFSYGDDVASGKMLAVEMTTFLGEQLDLFVEQEKLIIGICNGFQVLVRTGLLPYGTLGEQWATLAQNVSGRFQCQWVDMVVERNKCVFTANMPERISLQMAHGEGRFVASDDEIDTIEKSGLVALRYTKNPNGSTNGIAGICDPSGRIFGLMPHPERFIDATQHPNWRRGGGPISPQGLRIFENAVRYFRGQT